MNKRITIGLLIVIMLVLIAWDVYVVFVPPAGDTISAVTLEFSQRHPALGVALGVLLGHCLWPQRLIVSR